MDMSPREVSSSLFCYLEKVVETQCLNILRMSLCRRELGGQQTVSGGPGRGCLACSLGRPWLDLAICYVI